MKSYINTSLSLPSVKGVVIDGLLVIKKGDNTP